MIKSVKHTTGASVPTTPELTIEVMMADCTKVVVVCAVGDNSASIEHDRYLNALRLAEEAIYTVFFPDTVFANHVAHSRRQSGQAELAPGPLPATD